MYGAMINRDTLPIALATALTGRTPEFPETVSFLRINPEKIKIDIPIRKRNRDA